MKHRSYFELRLGYFHPQHGCLLGDVLRFFILRNLMPSNLFYLSGNVAVITGSSCGIGLASAQRMPEHGAKVIICVIVAASVVGLLGDPT